MAFDPRLFGPATVRGSHRDFHSTGECQEARTHTRPDRRRIKFCNHACIYTHDYLDVEVESGRSPRSRLSSTLATPQHPLYLVSFYHLSNLSSHWISGPP